MSFFSPYEYLQQALKKTYENLVGGDVDPLLRRCDNPLHGDFQSNACLSLAKKLQKSPRDLAQEIIQNLNLEGIATKIEIAGPGFINITLDNHWLATFAHTLLQNDRLGVAHTTAPKVHVVDFSSPNVAKEMHIGHLRTTITGEVICRTLEFREHPVHRINHIGDWGTQYGMLLEHLLSTRPDVVENPQGFHVSDLEGFYISAKKRFDSEEGFADRARSRVVALQSGDEVALKLWRVFVDESLRHCHELYKRMGVTLREIGESFYNPYLADVVDSLLKAKVAQVDAGAVCVFMDGFKNRDDEPLPFIIQKNDGGYNYATTDLASLRYRVNDLKGERLIYITDIRQAGHFNMLFSCVRLAGWVRDDIQLQHIGYGMILDQERKPFKTRSGDTVKLKDVFSEAVSKAKSIMEQSMQEGRAQYTDAELEEISERVGLSAIKYYDLNHSLSSDYVFSWDKVLAMEGNTGPYMLYAYARIKSIIRKSEHSEAMIENYPVILEHPAERALMMESLRFSDTVLALEQQLKPNILTDYLYNLAKTFNSFYDKNTGVSVLDADSEDIKKSRLGLCLLTARVLKRGLHLLSIDVVEKM